MLMHFEIKIKFLFVLQQTLSPATKEKYLNASRWYEHLQKIDDIRQNIPIVNLSPIHLHSWATGTHL